MNDKLRFNGELRASFVCTALMRIGTRMATVFDQHFAGIGVTQAQFRVLLAIAEIGQTTGLPPSALADHLLIERATVSVLTQRMVERGWLARAPGVNRRTFNLTLTETGQGLLQRLLPAAVELADETLQGIASTHLLEVHALLEVIEQRLRAGNRPEGGPHEPESDK